MKKLVLLVAFLMCQSNLLNPMTLDRYSFIQESSPKTNPYRILRAAISIDNGIIESRHYKGSGFLTKALSDAINSQATPIIVSGVILNNIFSSDPNISTIFFDRLLVFKHKQADLYLIIPKNYLENQRKELLAQLNLKGLGPNFFNEAHILDDKELSLDEIACGFVINHNHILESINSEKVLLAYLCKWETCTQKIATSTELLASITAQFLYNQVNPDNCQELFVHNLFTSKKIELDPEIQKVLGKFTLYIDGHGYFTRESYARTHMADKYAHIAGFSKQDFEHFWSFIEPISWYIHCCTCFGNGYNNSFINSALHKTETEQVNNFSNSPIISFVGIPDCTVPGCQTNYGDANFSDFFEIMEALAYQLQNNDITYVHTSFFKSILSKALGEINPGTSRGDSKITLQFIVEGNSYNLTTHNQLVIEGNREFQVQQNVPFVRLPSDSFKPLAITDEITVLNETPTTIDPSKTKVVVVTSPEITYPLVVRLNKNHNYCSDCQTPCWPYIASGIPGPAQHMFEDVRVAHKLSLFTERLAPFNSFLHNSIFFNNSTGLDVSVYPKVYIIKKLTCNNDTAIAELGDNFEHVGHVYIRIEPCFQWITGTPLNITGSIIVEIKEHNDQPKFYFQAQWNSKTNQCEKWKKLNAPQAQKAINQLTTITPFNVT